jgi:hypothetical protein
MRFIWHESNSNPRGNIRLKIASTLRLHLSVDTRFTL